jgi:hypothetical protein
LFIFVKFPDKSIVSVISGFRRDVDETCALLGYYAASNGSPVPSPVHAAHHPAGFLFFLDFLTLEDGTDTLFQNVGNALPFDPA